MDSVQISDNGEDEFIYRIVHPFFVTVEMLAYG